MLTVKPADLCDLKSIGEEPVSFAIVLLTGRSLTFPCSLRDSYMDLFSLCVSGKDNKSCCFCSLRSLAYACIRNLSSALIVSQQLQFVLALSFLSVLEQMFLAKGYLGRVRELSRIQIECHFILYL